MFSNKIINRICSVLWVMAFTLSLVQPAYAAPVEAHKAAPARLQLTAGNHDLTNDPGIAWNTLIGGSGEERGYDVTVDGNGNTYVVGSSNATWGTPLQAYSSNGNAFVAKFNSSGTLLWNTFLEGNIWGNSSDAIAVDGSGNVIVTGYSSATWGTPIRAYTSGDWADPFVVKLNPNGTVLWNTFLGVFSSFGYGPSVAVDGSGNIYIAAGSDHTWGSPLHAFTPGVESYNSDMFVAKLNSGGTLIWNTFYGGTDNDDGNAIVVDGTGNVAVIGTSGATWGTPLQVFPGFISNFIARFNSDGTLLWSTFASTAGDCITADGNGNIYVNAGSGSLAKFNSSGIKLWTTILYGSENTEIKDIAVDGSGNIYATGTSSDAWGSPLRPYTPYPLPNPTHIVTTDAFAARLSPAGVLQANTFLGSSFSDFGHGIAVDGNGNAIVTGASGGSWGNPIHFYTGNLDTFVARVDFIPPTVSSSLRASANPSNAASVNFTITFSEAVTGVDKTDFTLTTTGLTGASVTSVSGSGTTYTVVASTGTGNGTLRLDVVDDDSIIDAGNNPLGGTGSGNGHFTTGQTYTINKTAPEAITLVSPLGTVSTATPTFIWSRDNVATLYRLWIKNSGGTWVVQNMYSAKNICGTTNCAITLPTALVNGTYTWNIQTLTATQNGVWSGHSFTVAIPTMGAVTLVAPKGTTHIAKPTFIWSKDPVATLYRLWIKNNTTSAWVIQNLYAGKNICGVTNCAIVSPVTLANGSYTWYIDTLTATQNGQWSAQAITVSVPDVISSPSGSDTGVK